MRSPEEIEEFFHSELLPEVERHRLAIFEARKRAQDEGLSFLQKAGLIGGGLLVDAAMGGLTISWIAIGLALFGDRFPMLRMFMSTARPVDLPLFDTKQELIGRLVSFLEAGVAYDARGKIDERWLRKSGLWDAPYDRFVGEDRIYGKIGATSFEFSEVRIDKDYGRRSQMLFRGLMFVADFNKEFRGRTYLFPDVGEKHLGLIGRALQKVTHGSRRGELVQLENREFERFFRVHSTDPTEARYLLSSSLMRRLREFRENMNASMYVSFVGGQVFLLVEHPRNLLAAAPAEAVDADILRRWCGDLLFAMSLVEELDLNTRVWTKREEGAGAGSHLGFGTEQPASPSAVDGHRPLAGRRSEPETHGLDDSDSEAHIESSWLSNALNGHLPLWKTLLIFGFASNVLVSLLMPALKAMGADSQAGMYVLYALAGLPVAFLLWRNASNTRSFAWSLYIRLSVVCSLIGAVLLIGLALGGHIETLERAKAKQATPPSVAPSTEASEPTAAMAEVLEAPHAQPANVTSPIAPSSSAPQEATDAAPLAQDAPTTR